MAVPQWLAERAARWETIGGIALQTGFGALVGGLALVATIDSGDVRSLVAFGSALSGVAAALSSFGLLFHLDSQADVGFVMTMKWIGSMVPLVLLFAATSMGVVAATLFLF